MMREAEELAADSGDAKIILRAKLAKLPLLYAGINGEVGYMDYKGSDGNLLEKADCRSRLEEFKAIVDETGITHAEGKGRGPANVGKRISLWEEVLSAGVPKLQAWKIGDVWKFKPDPDGAGLPEKWYVPEFDDSDWASVRSDRGNGWESQGFAGYCGWGWYRRRFMVPAGFGDGELSFMLFGAVDEEAEIWLNGRKAFEHTCASTGLTPNDMWLKPFMFDPRSFLTPPGRENVIAVRVRNTCAAGGVWKPVWLLSAGRESSPRSNGWHKPGFEVPPDCGTEKFSYLLFWRALSDVEASVGLPES